MNRLYHGWNKYENQIAEGQSKLSLPTKISLDIQFRFFLFFFLCTSTVFINQLRQRKSTHDFPSEDDFEESALALVRLQKTYNLDISQVASGVLNGVKYG